MPPAVDDGGAREHLVDDAEHRKLNGILSVTRAAVGETARSTAR